jgi:glycosyltransferase involved in cell wall biosynthesis
MAQPHVGFPRISILICTRNGSRTIREALDRCLHEIRAWAPERGQLIVADNGSTDPTPAIAEDMLSGSGLDTKLIHAQLPGKIHALEAGVRVADGDVVCIIDDDNFIDSGYLRHVESFFLDHPEVGIIGSSNRLDDSVTPPEWFEWAGDHLACSTPSIEENVKLDAQGRRIGETGYVAGAGMAFRKEPLIRALDAGYAFYSNTDRKRRITGEDIEMCFLYRSMGLRFGFDPRIRVSHAIAVERLTQDAFWDLVEMMGAGSLGSDPFLFTRKTHGDQLPVNWTWQWQLASKVKRFLWFLLSGHDQGMTAAERRFKTRRDRHICWSAIRRIMHDRRGYTTHIRNVACGPWTTLRVR